MPDIPKIALPASYATATAVGFSRNGEQLALVSDDAPLPVVTTAPPPPPLSGSASQGTVVGPFAAVAGRTVVVSLGGNWDGSAHLLRSSDGGTTRLPLKVAGMTLGEFHASGVEQVWTETQEGIEFYLDLQVESGTISYEVSQ